MTTTIKTIRVRLFPDDAYNIINSADDELHTATVMTSLFLFRKKVSAKIYLDPYLKEKYYELTHGKKRHEITYEEEDVPVLFSDSIIGSARFVPEYKDGVVNMVTTVIFFSPDNTSPLNHSDASELFSIYLYKVEKLLRMLDVLIEIEPFIENNKGHPTVISDGQEIYLPWENMDGATSMQKEIVKLWCITDLPSSEIANKKFVTEGYVNNMLSNLRKEYPEAKIPKGARERSQYRERYLLHDKNQ